MYKYETHDGVYARLVNPWGKTFPKGNSEEERDLRYNWNLFENHVVSMIISNPTALNNVTECQFDGDIGYQARVSEGWIDIKQSIYEAFEKFDKFRQLHGYKANIRKIVLVKDKLEDALSEMMHCFVPEQETEDSLTISLADIDTEKAKENYKNIVKKAIENEINLYTSLQCVTESNKDYLLVRIEEALLVLKRLKEKIK